MTYETHQVAQQMLTAAALGDVDAMRSAATAARDLPTLPDVAQQLASIAVGAMYMYADASGRDFGEVLQDALRHLEADG